MIRRVGKDDKEALMLYLRSALVNSLGICSKIKKYGFDSDELYVYADFWSDGEIKYVFSVSEGNVCIFSTSNEVETLNIYVYLRDNFVGYMTVSGEEAKVRSFMRHTLFRQKTELGVFLANSRSFREPEFEENRAVPARVGDVDEMLALAALKQPQTVSHDKESLKASIKDYGAYIIKNDSGMITSMAIVEDKASRMVEIGIYTLEKEMKGEDVQMVAGALSCAVLRKKYACCCRTALIGEKQLLKNMGFQSVGTDLYLAR